MRGWRLVFAVAAAAATLWLMRTPAPPRPIHPLLAADPTAAELGATFERSRSGSISGQVLWSGARPIVHFIPVLEPEKPPPAVEWRPNPNAPRVVNSRVADAIVWLRPVALSRSRPWGWPPVTVEIAEPDFVVRQGDATGRIGVVRRGGAVTFAARENKLHSARARGAAFFTQMLSDPQRPVVLSLNQAGLVELSSASGYYWMRAYLLVSDHPYVAVTGVDGDFRFDLVPDGDYEVVCWKANWHVERLEHDPETTWPVRLRFQSPVTRQDRVRVVAGRTATVTFALSAEHIEPR